MLELPSASVHGDIERVSRLTAQAHALLDEAIEREITTQRRYHLETVVLFSGGKDSTVLTHLFKDRASFAAHCNTGIGIEQTREFVRDTCADWHLPLIEKMPLPNDTYDTLVLGRSIIRTGPDRGRVIWGGGFPGPAAHQVMYQRLKERTLDRVRAELVEFPTSGRVIFLAGRRADESARRKPLARKSPVERKGSVVWVSPLINWTSADLNAYRRVHPDVPCNEVADLLHMSGECLCGSYAHSGELEEIEMWFPQDVRDIRRLEKQVAAADVAPAERCRWGWGADKQKPSGAGPMCSSCSARFRPDSAD